MVIRGTEVIFIHSAFSFSDMCFPADMQHSLNRSKSAKTKQLEKQADQVNISWRMHKRVQCLVARQLHDIPEWWGTAVNVQAMVFGNMGNDCATGVAFTRDPSTGTNEFYGEFLVNAQGEDVVAGIRTPQELTIKARKSHGSELPSLEEVMPSIFKELLSVRSQLEAHYKDMQDIEFTIQQGKLYMLQTRNGKRTAPAALQIAVDMAKEGLISKSQALMSLKPDLIDQLLHPTLDPKAKKEVIAKGLPASPGAAGGKVAQLKVQTVFPHPRKFYILVYPRLVF